MMRFLNSLIGALFVVIIGFISVYQLMAIWNTSEPGSLDGLGYFLLLLALIPIIILILFFLFIFFYHHLNIKGIIFGGTAGFILYVVAEELLVRLFVSGDNLEILETARPIISFLPLVTLIISYLFTSLTNKCLHLNGMSIGVTAGYTLGYIVVLLIRWMNNSLTSYFFFDSYEKFTVIIAVLIGGFTGNHIGKKREIKEL